MSNQKERKKRDYKSFWEGSGCFGSPLDEHNYQACKEVKNKAPKYQTAGERRVWPCYVYDGEGNLLRIEHPEHRKRRWLGWD